MLKNLLVAVGLFSFLSTYSDTSFAEVLKANSACQEKRKSFAKEIKQIEDDLINHLNGKSLFTKEERCGRPYDEETLRTRELTNEEAAQETSRSFAFLMLRVQAECKKCPELQELIATIQSHNEALKSSYPSVK